MILSTQAQRLPENPSHFVEDSQIVEELLATENPDLFEILVQRYQNRVYRLILSILGPSYGGEAEEITQEVFLSVYRHLSTFRLDSQFGTWLYRIAYNRAIDEKRKARYRIPHLGEEALVLLPTEQRGSSPFATAAARERREVVGACIEELPVLYRSVLYLFYWMGYTVDEIGETLGMNPGTVKSYMHRARQRLYDRMKRRGIEHG